MTTEDTQTAQDTGTDTADSTTTTPASSGNAGSTFTQADVDRIVAERLARDRKQQQEEARKAAAKATMDAEQRAKAEKDEAEQRATEAEQRAKLASYRADLKGEVVDVNAALKLIDDEKHVLSDGSVNIKALLKDWPFLQKQGATAPGAGGVQGNAAPDPRSSFSAALAARGVKLGS